jgi:hypothetical protein
MHAIKTINGDDSLMEFPTTAEPNFCGRAVDNGADLDHFVTIGIVTKRRRAA